MPDKPSHDALLKMDASDRLLALTLLDSSELRNRLYYCRVAFKRRDGWADLAGLYASVLAAQSVVRSM